MSSYSGGSSFTTPINSDSDLSTDMEVEWSETMTNQGSEEANTEQLHGEGQAQLVQEEYNLRPRKATEESIYRAPWQNERKRRRQQRKAKDALPKNDQDETEDEEEEEEGENTPRKKQITSAPRATTQTSPPDPAPGITLLLKAAALLEQSDTPCAALNCPILSPHGSGLYRHPTPVPNSALANTYFAPSIPPPCVVAAYNAITKRPSLSDLQTNDAFFAHHTAPCRPSKHLDMTGKVACKSQHCGVRGLHNRGAYLHLGLDASKDLAQKVGHCFGISNPPPEVWAAALKITEERAPGGRMAAAGDHELVDDFSAHHVRFAHSHSAVDDFVEWQRERIRQRP